MKPAIRFITAAALLLLAAPFRCAADDQPLPADAFVRVTLIDRTKKSMRIFTPTKPGELLLPKLGAMTFTGVLPAEFARRIKDSYIERGIYTAETLNVVLESGPHRAPDTHPIRTDRPPSPGIRPKVISPAPDWEPSKQKSHNA